MAQSQQENLSQALRDQIPTEQFATDVRNQLRRILSSRYFSRSHQAAHLLTFLVEEALSADRSTTRNNLKEYSIAVHVFGRSVSFDPGVDNIVRVEVRRVRGKLEGYYADEGISDPILISIPKGTYVPLLQTRDYADVDLSGHAISHYELVRRRCANKWQTMYDANCLNLNRSVMVIVPSRRTLEDAERRQRLLADTRGGAVDHANVATIHEVEATDEQVIIAAANLPGRRFREVVEGGQLSREEAFTFARELAAALASGHSLGVFHGILSPDWITFDSAYPHVHILPYRLSALVDIGYPAYDGFRAPEWGQGYEPGLCSDVWAFGALVWFAYSGAPPPSAQPAHADATEIQSMPPSLANIVSRCLQPDQLARHVSAVDVLREIEQIASPPSAKVENVPAPDPPAASHKIIKLTAILLTALAFVILLALGLRQNTSPSSPRVVVLPLENVSGDPETEPYCRVMAEMLAANLARLPGAQVVSSRSIDSKHDRLTTDFLRQSLNVQYAVDGTLLKTKDGFQVTVGLIRVADGSYVWTESHGGAWGEIAARLDKLAERAAQTMGLVVQREQMQLTPSRPASNVPAYEEWLKGRFAAIEYWNTAAPDRYIDAERRLLRALELQPAYTDAMVDLAQLYVSAFYPPNGRQQELFEKAESLAERALLLDPESGPAHGVVGSVYTDTGRVRLAMPHLVKAVQLSPHDPNPRNYLSIAYEAMGFWEASSAERDEAIKRDPLLQGIRVGGMFNLARTGRVQEALRLAAIAEKESAIWNGSTAYVRLIEGDAKRAEAALKDIATSEPPAIIQELMALAQAAQGRPELAKAAIKKSFTTELRRDGLLALLCAATGEQDLLVRNIAVHPYIRNYRSLISEPLYRPYRTYPPFQKLVRETYEEWRQNLKDFGPLLAVAPPDLPGVEEYLGQT